MTELEEQLKNELEKLNTLIQDNIEPLKEAALKYQQAVLDKKAYYHPSLFPPEIADKIDYAAIRVTGFVWDCLQVRGYSQGTKKQSKIRKALGFLKPNER